MTETEGTDREAAIRQLIAERAYHLWETQGCPVGCDLIHWHQAEQEIRSSPERGSAKADAVQQGSSQTTAQSTAAASRAR